MKKKSFLMSAKWREYGRRLAIVCLVNILLLLSTAYTGYAKNISQEKRITVKMQNVSIVDVFKEIQAKTDFDFFYKNEQLPQSKKISVDAKDLSVEEILNRVLKGTNLTFKLVDTDIVISPLQQNKQEKRKISGKVIDSKGLPLPGVSVVIEGTTRGSVTDFDGNYEIDNVESNQVILYSFIGMTSQRLIVSATTSFDITLQDDTQGLEEVVVIGYGAVQRKQITSSVATVDTDDIAKVTASSPVQQIQGRVAGLTVSTPKGSDPNASPDILIRGVTSTGGQSPLIIVDGVAVGSLDIVAPEDIATFSILKDGSAAAIYGSRGTNGVILITTKEGKESKPTVEYSGYYAFDQISKRPDILTADEFRALGNKMGVATGDASTDWYDEMLQSNHNTVHNIAFSAGNKNSNYRASINYMDNKGVALESFKKNLSGRININHKAINDRLNVRLSLSASQAKYRLADYGAFGSVAKFNPTRPVYEENGEFATFQEFGVDNPIGNILNYSTENIKKVLLANVFAEFEVVKGLTVGGRAAWKVEDANSGSYTSSKNENLAKDDIKGVASTSSFYSYKYTYEGNINYRKRFDKHDFNVMANYTHEEDTWYTYSMSNSGFVNDKFLWHSIGSGLKLTNPVNDDGVQDLNGPASMGSGRSEKILESWRGRLVYTYDDKYALTVSYNREGSSIFGENNKWGNFYGVSAGWTISDEDFMENLTFVNYLKLRVGYGETGNPATGPYNSLSTVVQEGLPYVFNGNVVSAYALEKNPNPDLKWERKKEYNIGFDYALAKNRFDGSVDLYSRKTDDMLYSAAAPVPSLIKPTIVSNIGEISSKGIELSINAKILQDTEVKWNANFNASYNVNEVEKLSNADEEPVPFYAGDLPGNGLGSAYRVKEGGSIGDFYGPRFDKFDENGGWVFKDLNDEVEGYHADTDKEVIGNGMPNYFVGLTNSLEYKRFDLEIFMRGALDYQVLNVGRIYMENLDKFPQSNIYTSALSSPLRAPSQYSDYYLEDGDYLKIQNISLGYTFDTSKWKNVSYAKLYVSCSNVHTFTNYSGLSPELGGHSGITPGFDNLNFYPVTRTFTIGAVVKF